MEIPAGPWIDGATWSGSSGVERSVVSPFDGAVLATIREADGVAVEAALASAERCFAGQRRTPPAVRRELLLRVVSLLEENAEALAQTISGEAGKPIKLARGEVKRCCTTFRLAAEEAGRLDGEYLRLDADARTPAFRGVVQRVPLGVISAITPFNFPLNLVAHKVAPALAAGNTVVLKPAGTTPLSALFLARIVSEAGAPPGLFNVVPCRPAVAAPLVEDPRPKLVTFTGSPAVGWGLKARAGKKRVSLELGGNAPNIVHEDADLDHAAARCAFGAYAYAGQVCISVQRVLVHAPVYERFREALLAAAASVRAGDPADPTLICGPMITEAEAQRVESWIDAACAAGGRALLRGEREGALLQPSVIEEPPWDCDLVAREVFGPVMTLHRYETFEQALAMANDTAYGLQAGVFTRDLGRVFHAFEKLEYGGIVIGDCSTVRVDAYPYGGVKDSGLGREGVRYAIEEMTERRILVLHLRDRGAGAS